MKLNKVKEVTDHAHMNTYTKKSNFWEEHKYVFKKERLKAF